jgi:predicted nucleotidyltransferase
MALSTAEKKAIKELHAKLSVRYALSDFRIYGSKAAGTETPDSDIDVMIVLGQTSPEIESQIDDIIFDINLKYDCLISALFFGADELQEGPFGESPIYKKAIAEGIQV